MVIHNCPGYFVLGNFFLENFYSNTHILYRMNVETLKQILEKIPGDYEVRYHDHVITGTVEIDTENKRLILK